MIDVDLPARPKHTVPIVAEGPFAPAYRPFRLRPPQDTLVLIVKTTLAILPGKPAAPIAEQAPPTGDLGFDDEPATTLRYASDFAPFKPKADVILVGHAYPPSPGASAASVQMMFGHELRAGLAAVGDREWASGRPSDPRPFTRIPLRYERAFGGPGYAANPVGTGVIEGIAGARLPNLERPERLIHGPGDRPAPACFAPIGERWPARAAKLGTYDGAWLRERWPYFPRDFDYGYFNVAPPDQQIAYPRGDEEFHLGGVHPELKVVSGRLPGIVPRAFAQLDRDHGLRFREIALHLDTVWFDADAMRVSLVFRGLMDVSAERAPEVLALFVCEGRAGVAIDAEEAQRRFFALAGAMPSGSPAAPGKSARAQVGAAAEDPRASGGKERAFAAGPVPAPPAKGRAAIEALIGSGAALAGAMLAGCDLMRADLAGKDLRGAILKGAYLDGARLDGADLRGAVLTGASALRASFRGADLRGANLAEATLVEADFSEAKLDDASMPAVDATGARLFRASLHRVNLTEARLERAVFDEASAASADFSGAALTAASFRRATLDDAQIYDAAAERCHFDEASLARFRADGAALAHASFTRAKAQGAAFKAANLRDAVFLEADLSGALFDDANLERALLSRALGKGARFCGARLVKAQALKADLMEANFTGADLSGADLRGANLYGVETLDAAVTGINLDQAIVAGSKLAR